MVPALRILGVIFGLLAYVVGGYALGERLQELRRPGVERLEFPGRALLGWEAYLDPTRYEPGALWLIRLLAALYLVLPAAAFVVYAFMICG
jgi:hypothetical protein